MEVILVFAISIIQPLFIVLMAGRSAWSVNIKYWPWFIIGLFPPFISVIIHLFFPERKKEMQESLKKPVSSEEIFDPILHLEDPKISIGNRIEFLARA